jgi:outer membrane immunogenic protein
MKTFKLALLGATFLASAGAISAANAADVYARGGSLKDGPVEYMPAITWTGFYIGVHAGGVFGDTIDVTLHERGEVEEVEKASGDADNTWLAGVHVGYNWQTERNLVLGIEGSISAIGSHDVDFNTGEKFKVDDNFVATIRGRLGYAFGQTLVYGTGGVAFLDTDGFANLFGDTETGWVAGGGFEYKFRPNMSFGVEGLYYAFTDSDRIEFAKFDLDRNFWSVTGRLTYYFGDRHDEPLK